MLKPDERPTDMRRAFVLLLVAGLLLAATSALAQPGRDQRPGDETPDRPTGGEPDDAASARSRGNVPMGAFQVEESSRTATGEHLSFTYDDTGIQGFSAAGRALFDATVVGESDEDDDRREGIRVAGAQIRVRTPSYTFTAHDAPTAASKLETDGTITLAFADGVVLARENGERVRFSFGDVTGVLRGDNLATSSRSVTASDELLVVLDRPRGTGDQDHYRDLGRAIARGHIGAEATLNLHDGDRVVDDVVSYGNVTVTTTKAERGNLTVLIEGHGTEGRVVVLNVDGRILGAQAADKLDIVLDNVSIGPATDLTDILDPDDDGYTPEYYLVFDPRVEAFQLIVTLPHYSVHVLSVTTPFVLPPPAVTIGILAGIALLVPTALLLFRRR
jgi:hypothetical protein